MGERGEVYLIHFVDKPLDLWLRFLRQPEERGDPWEEFSTLLFDVWHCRKFQAGKDIVYAGPRVAIFPPT
jgi:hypothetical protein